MGLMWPWQTHPSTSQNSSKRVWNVHKQQCSTAIIVMGSLPPSNVGFHMARDGKLQENWGMNAPMMKFWRNSTHSKGCRDSQLVCQCNIWTAKLLWWPNIHPGVWATWMPDLYKYYANTLEALCNHDPSLKHIFPTSIFSSTTYHLDPQTICFKHTNFANPAL